MTITKATLEKQAYVALRERIMTGQLPVGQRLLPKDLAAGLAISQTPIKGAMALLQRDGLIEGHDRHRAVVRRFSAADVNHLYDARQLIEIDAVAKGIAAGRTGAAFMARLKELFAQQLAQMALMSQTAGTAEKAQTDETAETAQAGQQATAEVVRLDREFHELIAALSDNPVLIDWHRTLMRQTHTLRIYSSQNYKFDRAQVEHQAIIDAFAAGDTAAITGVLQEHLQQSRDDMLLRMADVETAPTST